jgi:hypothetical protein
MYMKWVKNRLLPTFRKKYGEKMMILIQDNVRISLYTLCAHSLMLETHACTFGVQPPYHHKREIGSLREFTTKKALYDHLVKVASEVKEITLPINEKRKRAACELKVKVTPDFHLKSASTQIPDIDEMRDGFLRVLRENKSPKVQCKVENMLRAAGHRWLWTPPYCPWLQPVRARSVGHGCARANSP